MFFDSNVAAEYRQRRLLSFLTATVAFKGSRWSEFAQLVTHHVFSRLDFDMLAAIVNEEGVANELRNDGARPGPSFDWLATSGRFRFLNFAEQLFVYERSFFL